MELYIFRHGQTIWNAARKIQGSTDIDLTQEGIAMAKETAKAIENLELNAIYSSPLKRAYDTACILRGNRSLEVIKDPRIRELSFGDLEGTGFEHIQDPSIDEKFGTFFTHPEKYHRPPNGESLEEVCARGADFIEDIRKKYGENDRVMIVAHGAMNKAMLKHIRGFEMKDLWYGQLQKNCGAVIVRLTDNDFEIIDECKLFYKTEK